MDIAVDGAGNSYIAGGTGDSITFGSTTLSPNKPSIFVAELDGAGNSWQWAVAGAGVAEWSESGRERCGIAVDAAGNSYVVGDFRGATSFGSTTLTSRGGVDVFVAKLASSSHTWSWAVSAGGGGED